MFWKDSGAIHCSIYKRCIAASIARIWIPNLGHLRSVDMSGHQVRCAWSAWSGWVCVVWWVCVVCRVRVVDRVYAVSWVCVLHRVCVVRWGCLVYLVCSVCVICQVSLVRWFYVVCPAGRADQQTTVCGQCVVTKQGDAPTRGPCVTEQAKRGPCVAVKSCRARWHTHAIHVPGQNRAQCGR